MQHCKFCRGELPPDTTVCPHCGKDNAEAAPETAADETVTAEIAATEQPHTAEEAVPEGVAAEETVTDATVGGEKDVQDPAAGSAEADETQTPERISQPEGTAAPEAPAQEQPAPARTPTPGKIAAAVAGIVVLVGVLIALIVSGMQSAEEPSAQATETAAQTQATEAAQAETEAETTAETVAATTPADGNPDDVTAKGSYSVSDEEAEASRDTVVATLGSKELTNAQLRVFYWMEVQGFLSNYGSYASYFGLDYTQPLDTQVSMEESGITWQQYFLQSALTNWQQFQALAMAGENNGMKISDENQAVLDSLQDTVNEMAATYDMTPEELLKANFGAGTGMEEYQNFQRMYYQGLPYYEAETAKLVPTDEVLREYFETHAEEYASGGVSEDDMYVDVRHILIQPEGGTTDDSGNTTYSGEEWEACRAKAQAILDEYLAGEQTEEAFAALATEYSEDPGSQSNGGLYQQVYPGQMVEEFDDWCFDTGRTPGDTGLVKTTYGYHVMYFVSSEPQWMYYAESDWTNEQTNALVENLVSSYPLEISYDKISLGVVDLGG